MSMLADRRKKANYCLQPIGKPLHNDSNSFGVKMLEKMGWTVGKGLGKNESGDQEFVRIKYKQDIKGFGYSDNDNHWTEHEKNYNSILDSLNNCHENAVNTSDDSKSKLSNLNFEKKEYMEISGESLEEKSKKSRARLHYTKFTKGKDLSQYSKKDLANIFGKKSLDILSSKEKMQMEATEKCIKKNTNTLTFNSNSSSHEYFKQKKEEKLKKGKMNANYEKDCQILKNKKTKTLSNNIEKRNKLKMNIEKVQKEEKKCKEKMSVNISRNPVATKEYETTKLVKRTKSKRDKVKDKMSESELIVEIENEKKCVKDSCTVEGFNKSDEVGKIKSEKNFEQESVVCYKKEIEKNKNGNISTDFEENFQKKNKKNIENFISVSITDDSSKHKMSKNIQKGEHFVENFLNINDDSKDNLSSFYSATQNFLTITKYCAEKFRNTDLNGFKGSNLKDLCGYALPRNFEVKVHTTSNCMEQIGKLYKNSIMDVTLSTKYGISDEKKFKKYKVKAKKAKLLKKKVANFDVTHLKKKSLYKQVKI